MPTESIAILVEADNQASKELMAVGDAAAALGKRAESIFKSLDTPIEKYNDQLEELIRLEKQGIISSDKLASAKDRLNNKIVGAANGLKDSAKNTKASTEFAGAIANAFGGSQIGGFASQLANITEKTSQFGEVAKQGGAGALALKAGLVAIVGALAFQVGKATGDLVFETTKSIDDLAAATKKLEELRAKSSSRDAKNFAQKTADIELIRDPDEKRQKYQQMLDNLKKNIGGVKIQVANATKHQDEYNNSWAKTIGWAKYIEEGNKTRLEDDRKHLADMEKEKETLDELLSQRNLDNEEKRKSNDLITKSEEVIRGLKNELGKLEANADDVISQLAISENFVGPTAAIDKIKEEIRLLEEKQGLTNIDRESHQQTVGLARERDQEDWAKAGGNAALDEAKDLTIQIALEGKKQDLLKAENDLRQKSLEYLKGLSEELGTVEAENQDVIAQLATSDKFTGPTAAVDMLKEKIRLLKEGNNLSNIRDKADKNTHDEKSQGKAEGLIREIELAKAKQELLKAEADEKKRIGTLAQNEIEKLKEQEILLTKGKEAAHAYALEKQGLDKETASKIARDQSRLDRLQPQEQPVNQARESRFITRGSASQGPMVKVLEEAQKASKQRDALNAKIDKLNTTLEGKGLKVVRVA